MEGEGKKKEKGKVETSRKEALKEDLDKLARTRGRGHTKPKISDHGCSVVYYQEAG